VRIVVDLSLSVRAVMASARGRGRVLDYLERPSVVLVYSQELLDDLVGVLRRPKFRDRYGLTDARIDVEFVQSRASAIEWNHPCESRHVEIRMTIECWKRPSQATLM
jgi:predicted nucleic acid-binding protein